MNIAIIGYRGFLGSITTNYFKSLGNFIIEINRNEIFNHDLLYTKLSNADVVINLAGASIAKRWTKRFKVELFQSRVSTTFEIVKCLNRIENKKITFINTSAIGLYDDIHEHNEKSENYGDNFLSKLVMNWENQLNKITNIDVNVVIIRLGIVLDKRGGFLNQLLNINRFRILPYLGDRKSNLCFIDSSDFLKALKFIIDTKQKGILNLVSSIQTTNYEIAKLLSKFNKTSFVFSVPNFILKVIFGDGFFVFKGTPLAIPERLMSMGFIFEYDTIEKSLKHNIDNLESN